MDYKQRYKKHLEDQGVDTTSPIPCEICGTYQGQAYDVHHIVFRSETTNPERDNPRNLILVCRKCHDYLHGNKREARRKLVEERGLEELLNMRLL